MKALTILSVLQTIGIAVLVIHSLRSQDDGATLPARGVSTTGCAAAISGPDIFDRAAAGAASVADEDRLRTIMREELAALQLQPKTQSAPSVSGVHPRNELEDERRQQRVAQQIDAYASVGSITDQEMELLQVEIAQLDAASRKQMMSKLIRALNSGELKGRL
jgi:hypothetical protein